MERSKFKTVQEVLAKGEELPQRYLQKVADDASAINDFVPEMNIPVINLGFLTSSSARNDELNKLRSALSKWGCVQVINHGMSEAFLDKMREVTKQFFALPIKAKESYNRETGSIEGYGNDMILSDDQILDWTDRLYLTTYPEDQQQLKFWPKIPIVFRETLHAYTAKLELVTKQFLKAMAKSLDLEESCFLEMYGEPGSMFARFNFYPPCPRPDKILGIKPHADGSAITILLPDKEVEGLQFQKDDNWFRALSIPHALLINVGDQVEIMSNGIFKSPVHRVVTNSLRERISVATFCCPRQNKEIEPVDGLVNETRPRLYKTVKNYTAIYFDYYQQGRRPIEAARI